MNLKPLSTRIIMLFHFLQFSIQFSRLFKTFTLDEISNKLTGKLRFDVVLIVNSTARFPELSYRT